MKSIDLSEFFEPFVTSGFRGEDLDRLKEAVKQANDRLYDAYVAGMPIQEVIYVRSDLVDLLLELVWDSREINSEECATLVAVGGYGRQEMHPASDIDLLILLPKEPDEECQEKLSAFLMYLWDIGLEIGHSVRTVEDCLEEAGKDLTVITNLIESRFLLGSEDLYQKLQDAITPEQMWNSRDFFIGKLEEQQARYNKYDNTAYRVEPNLKDGPGGLRDIQTIMWVIQRHYGELSSQELLSHGLLTSEEYSELIENRDFLWQIRFVMHSLAKRKEDRLLFDYQQQLTQAFADSEEKGIYAVESFMQQYYQAITRLSRLNDLLLNLLKEQILSDPDTVSISLSEEYEEKNRLINIRDPKLFIRRPKALLEVFLTLQKSPTATGITPMTARMVRQHLNLIDEHFRADKECKAVFIEIMKQTTGVTLALRQMNRLGVLEAYLPAFKGIVGRMQFDLYHAYTVDEHTLRVIRNIRRFSTHKGEKELPFCSHVFNALPRPELLYLGGLFHDIAKGRGGDHATLGAYDAFDFCRSHGLSIHASSTVSWLVEYHLFMSMVIQKKDISDPQVVRDFAEIVIDPIRLDYLFLLTIADIRGTNIKLWNDWKYSLLKQLYKSTHYYLQNQTPVSEATAKIRQEKRDSSLENLVENGFSESDCLDLWEQFDEDYFLHHSVNTISWHAESILSPKYEAPIVRLRQTKMKSHSLLFIYQKDDPELFVRIVSALEQLRISTVEARISSLDDGHELYTFHILNAENKALLDQPAQQELIDLLKHNLHTMTMGGTSSRLTREMKHMDVKTLVNVLPDENKSTTVIEITTRDHPSLLSLIGSTLYELGVQIHDARISTLEEQAHDTFLVTDFDNQPLLDGVKIERVKERLHEVLG